MEAEMKRACLKASAKLAIGLSLLVAVIGIRLVTTTPEGIESEIQELERLDALIASEANLDAPEAESGATDDSIGSVFSGALRETKPNNEVRSGDGDKLVSCRLAGRTHFMRANDCAMRGGKSTILSDDR
jgi:hypothetical protein